MLTLRPSLAVCVNGQLGSVVQLTFHQQVADMRLDRLDADVQLLTDILIRFALGYKKQDFLLAFGQA